MAEPVLSPSDATRTKDRQSRYGEEAVGSLVLMRQGWDYEQVKKFGSHAGQPENRHAVQSNGVFSADRKPQKSYSSSG
jgi:hypothetical protein